MGPSPQPYANPGCEHYVKGYLLTSYPDPKALPKISAELSSGNSYIGIGNSFLLAQTVIQPAMAQLCDIFGRRWPMIINVVTFAVGSGIAGGARSTVTIIAGRTLQGLGSGGIMLLVELIVCDLVPQRERGKYLGIVLSTAALGAIAGPIVGGALADQNWRWCVACLNVHWSGSAANFVVQVLLHQSSDLRPCSSGSHRLLSHPPQQSDFRPSIYTSRLGRKHRIHRLYQRYNHWTRIWRHRISMVILAHHRPHRARLHRLGLIPPLRDQVHVPLHPTAGFQPPHVFSSILYDLRFICSSSMGLLVLADLLPGYSWHVAYSDRRRLSTIHHLLTSRRCRCGSASVQIRSLSSITRFGIRSRYLGPRTYGLVVT
jgi:MFS family permease